MESRADSVGEGWAGGMRPEGEERGEFKGRTAHRPWDAHAWGGEAFLGAPAQALTTPTQVGPRLPAEPPSQPPGHGQL